jgi:AAA family ATP:ADP antiporter
MIVDIFTSEQGKRLFGFIAAGATLGAISGSVFTVSTVEHMAPGYLMIGAALMLEVAVFCVRRLSGLSEVLASRPRTDQPETPIGGTLLGGFRDALSSSYLLNVSLFLLLYAVTSTFLYFQQAAVVGQSFQSRAAQTAFFATVDLGVNLLTLGVQLFLTGRILRRFGVATTLSLLPVFSMLGFGMVAVLPTLSSVVGFQLFRRAGNFAIARPTREVLFTVLPREDRYKAKSFIDTAVYRLGDRSGPGLLRFWPLWVSGSPRFLSSLPRSRPFGWSTACGSAADRTCLRGSRKLSLSRRTEAAMTVRPSREETRVEIERGATSPAFQRDRPDRHI